MVKRLIPYILTAAISAALALGTVGYLGQRSSDKQIDRLSNDLATSRALAIGLDDQLAIAQEDKRESDKRVVELEKLYDDYYQRTQKQQSEIASGLEHIAGNISQDTDSVESVRIGLEQIKDFIKALP